jgi:hypothetical protein
MLGEQKIASLFPEEQEQAFPAVDDTPSTELSTGFVEK